MTKKLLLFIFFIVNNQLFANDIILKPFKANFVQTVTNFDNVSITYKGKIFLNKENSILWKYKTPIIKNIYIHKKMVIIEEPELEQAIFASLDDNLNLSLLISKATKIDKDKYSASLFNTDYLITLNKNKIRQISYNDPLDNKIIITFFSVKENPKFDKNLFIFKAKPNYDIIRK